MYGEYELSMLFIGDSDRMLVHNVSLETRQCKMNEITAMNKEIFTSLKDAHILVLNCQYCIGKNS